MTNQPGPTDPSSPETGAVRPPAALKPSRGCPAAPDAPNEPQTGAQPVDGSEPPQTPADAESPADTTQGRHTAAQTPPRGTDGCQAEAVLRAHVRAALRNAGLSQAETARQLDVSTKHLCQMLAGRAPLTLRWAERILALCGQRIVVDVEPGGDPDAPGWCPSCGRGDVAPTGEQLAAAQRDAERLRVVLGRVRERAAEWASLAPADDWGPTPGDTVLADAGRRLLALIGPGGAVEHLAGPDEPGGVDTDGPQR